MTTQATTLEATQLPLPPGERDFEVYRLVTVEQKSTRTAAKILGISQTRVCQIVQRVADFLIATAPDSEEHPRKQQQLNVARQAAAEQISYLGQQAMRCFRKSKGPKTTVRQVSTASQEPVTITTVRESEGDCRYLFAIAKLAVIGSKLPTAGMLGAEIAREAEDELREVSDEDGRTGEVGPAADGKLNTPSQEDCSARASEQEVTAKMPNEAIALNCFCRNIYGDNADLRTVPKCSQQPPVQSAANRPKSKREEFLAQLVS